MTLIASLAARVFVVGITSVVCLTGTTSAEAQSGRVGQRRVQSRPVESTFADAVREVLAETQVPGGMAFLQSGGEDEFVHYQFGGTLDDAIRTFGLLHAEYRTELTDGVLLVRPTKGVPSLLMTRISHIELRVGEPVFKGWNDIRSMPEFEESVRRLHLSEGWKSPDGPGQPKSLGQLAGDSSDRVVLRNATILDILNEIARRSGSAVWEYREYSTASGRAYTFRIR